MDQPHEPRAENEAALRERLARLSEASLRINESLDFDTVLQGALDSARALTAARYGVMTLLDGAGRVQDFLASGMTAGEAEQLWQTPEGQEIFSQLGGAPEPLRIPDLVGYVRSLGFAEFSLPLPAEPASPFLASPLLHGSERVGNLFLAGREDGREFSREDEQTLVMFAAQAALVIANARTHREERRARADLETLIDTSPVGVVVLDALSGALKSLNREGRRIADSLRDPGQSPATLLDVLTCVRADGSEVSLREFPLAGLLGATETLRAEEVVLRVPDGRSVRVLLNTTPVRSETGAVESVVMTVQDMAAVEELERLRAEFLAMVSHELRAPLAAVKGSVATMLESARDPDPAVVRQFFRIIGEQADHMHGLVSDLLDVTRIETGTLAVDPEPAELTVLVERARSAFGDAGGRNSLVIDLDPGLPLVMADRRRIVQVLGNLLTNAARNSPEASPITLSAAREDVHVAVSVSDEGRGIPAERLPHLFRKFSGAQPDERAGDTGLGLAICRGIVEAHGGRIRAESEGPGLGARFTFTLPTVPDGGGAAAARAPARSSRRAEDEAEERARVLAVDDDPADLRYVQDALRAAGYVPLVTGDPEEASRLMAEERPALVLLDLMLPGTDGIKLMQELPNPAGAPVIFLSAYGRDELIARAFAMGAADYVVKPFSPTELAARIGAALSRRARSEPSAPYVLGDLTIDYAERSVTLAGRAVPLLPLEYRMLAELSAGAGRVLTYEHLLGRVWEKERGGDLRPMRTIVRKLRQKLGDDADDPAYIFTEPRVGYRMPKGEA